MLCSSRRLTTPSCRRFVAHSLHLQLLEVIPMASQRMLEFMLSLPLCEHSPPRIARSALIWRLNNISTAVYAFDQTIKDRMLLYTSSEPLSASDPDAAPYSVICAPGYTSRGIPAYLVSFFCPSVRHSDFQTEIFTVQIRKDFWGKLPPVDWFSLIVDGAQRYSSFEYP